ncbi:MAG: ROK family protein, partial [Chloroflexota bacterium]
VTDDPSVVCRCGNIGCLEALAGGAALGRAAQAAAEEGRSARLQTALDQRGEVTAERRRWSATGSSRGSRWPAGSRRASRPA